MTWAEHYSLFDFLRFLLQRRQKEKEKKYVLCNILHAVVWCSLQICQHFVSSMVSLTHPKAMHGSLLNIHHTQLPFPFLKCCKNLSVFLLKMLECAFPSSVQSALSPISARVSSLPTAVVKLANSLLMHPAGLSISAWPPCWWAPCPFITIKAYIIILSAEASSLPPITPSTSTATTYKVHTLCNVFTDPDAHKKDRSDFWCTINSRALGFWKNYSTCTSDQKQGDLRVQTEFLRNLVPVLHPSSSKPYFVLLFSVRTSFSLGRTRKTYLP